MKTFAQILVVWTLILFVFPYFIAILEDKLGVERLSFPFQKIIAAVFFIAISLIGLSSAVTMSRVGRGTPLPLDAAGRFGDLRLRPQSDGDFGNWTGFGGRGLLGFAACGSLCADGCVALAVYFSTARRGGFEKAFRRRLRKLP